ncbi:MAG: ankyrin repeat domain-containing protein [Bacteroidales bacterium]|nr:ankyrin repeat domain-containing protein [Bacteroidales bacterium]
MVNGELVKCIDEDNVNQLLLLMDMGYDVFATEDGSSLLHYAAQRNSFKCAKVLIQKSIEVDIKDGDELTPLIWTAYYDAKEVAELLIDQKADIDYQVPEQETQDFLFSLVFRE